MGPRQRPQRVQPVQPRAVLPEFEETPTRFIGQGISNIIDHINPRGGGCCNWHIAIASVSAALEAMKRQPCLPEYEPAKDWQCRRCFFMQDDEMDNYASEGVELFCWHCDCEKS